MGSRDFRVSWWYVVFAVVVVVVVDEVVLVIVGMPFEEDTSFCFNLVIHN